MPETANTPDESEHTDHQKPGRNEQRSGLDGHVLRSCPHRFSCAYLRSRNTPAAARLTRDVGVSYRRMLQFGGLPQ
jgi:hypothetical protein